MESDVGCVQSGDEPGNPVGFYCSVENPGRDNAGYSVGVGYVFSGCLVGGFSGFSGWLQWVASVVMICI